MSNQTKSILAFVIVVVLSISVYVWMVVWNTGTVSVSAETPFILTVGDSQRRCEVSPCALSLHTDTYTLKVEKSGYFPYETRVTLQRSSIVPVEAKLEFMPYFNREKMVESFPPEAIVSDAAPYLQREGNLQKLFAPTQSDPRLITTFQTLKKPLISFASDIVLLADGERLFMVDILNKRKELIFSNQVNAMSVSSSGHYILVESEMEGLPLLGLFDVMQKKLAMLPIQTSLARTAWTADDELLFISFQEFNTDLEAAFAEVGLNADELASGTSLALTDRLLKFRPADGTYRVLLDIPEDIPIVKMALSGDGKEIVAGDGAGKLHVITLKP